MGKGTSSGWVVDSIRLVGFATFTLAALFLAHYLGRLEGLGRPTGFYTLMLMLVWVLVYQLVYRPSKGGRKTT